MSDITEIADNVATAFKTNNLSMYLEAREQVRAWRNDDAEVYGDQHTIMVRFPAHACELPKWLTLVHSYLRTVSYLSRY